MEDVRRIVKSLFILQKGRRLRIGPKVFCWISVCFSKSTSRCPAFFFPSKKFGDNELLYTGLKVISDLRRLELKIKGDIYGSLKRWGQRRVRTVKFFMKDYWTKQIWGTPVWMLRRWDIQRSSVLTSLSGTKTAWKSKSLGVYVGIEMIYPYKFHFHFCCRWNCSSSVH